MVEVAKNLLTFHRASVNFYCSYECSMRGRRDEFSDFRPILGECRKTSKHRNKKFNLTLEYVKALWKRQRGICPYTNISMELPTVQSMRRVPFSASLDRIDSSKGYEEGNVEFVCLFVNYGKNGFSKQQVIEFLHKIAQWRNRNATDSESEDSRCNS